MTVIFRNKNGKIIKHPRLEYIKSDLCEAYSSFDDELNIAVSEVMGQRESQEDRVCYGTLKSREKLSFKQQKEILLATFADLQQQLVDQFPTTGSTAISNIIQKNNIVTAWIGDSVTYLAIFNKEGKLTLFSPLNKNVHHPNINTSEGQRVLNTAIKGELNPPFEYSSGVWRLGDGLSLSRALGDKCSEPYGLIHTPEISMINYEIPAGGFGWILTACDGLTEAMSEHEIKKFISQHSDKPLEQLSRLLTDFAVAEDKGNSTDNVSVMIALLDPKIPPRVLALFDGHNGSEISQALSNNFLSVLQKKIALYCKK